MIRILSCALLATLLAQSAAAQLQNAVPLPPETRIVSTSGARQGLFVETRKACSPVAPASAMNSRVVTMPAAA